jgi:N-acetyl-anhydromuramyl-L-alanine amidase AmpD
MREGRHYEPTSAARLEAVTGGSALYDVSDLLPRHPRKRYKRRDPAGVDLIIVHHSGRLSKHYQTFDGMRNAGRFVVRQRKDPRDGSPGWPGFPYQAWIPYGAVLDRDGRRVWFRGQTDEVRSWHTAGLNRRGWSICLQGSLSKHAPSEFQMQTLGDAIQWIRARFGVTDPKRVIGHCDAGKHGGRNKPACPGSHAVAWLCGLSASGAA